jgi:hypothetical protein
MADSVANGKSGHDDRFNFGGCTRGWRSCTFDAGRCGETAPTLPLDGNFPFLHLNRKFMHLGFHIYDVGFQSPNVEAARPLVYATSLLLVLVIIGLNLAAILIRNHLREKYRALEG